MTPQIAAYLRRNNVVPDIGPDTAIDSIKMNTTTFQGGSLVFLLFLDQSASPKYVLRMPRDRSRPARVLANYAALERLKSVYQIGETVPRPVYLGEAAEGPFTLETCINGTSLFAKAAADYVEASFCGTLESVMEWLWHLHSATPTAESTEFRSTVESSLNILLESADLKQRATRYLIDSVHEALDAGFPFAFCQGDFNANNILIADNGLISGVVDWEYSGNGPAVFDLLSLIRSTVLHDPGEEQFVERIEALFNPTSSLHSALARRLDQYAGPDNRRAMFLVYVVQMVSGFVSASGSIHDPQLRPWVAYLNTLPPVSRRISSSRRVLTAVA